METQTDMLQPSEVWMSTIEMFPKSQNGSKRFAKRIQKVLFWRLTGTIRQLPKCCPSNTLKWGRMNQKMVLHALNLFPTCPLISALFVLTTAGRLPRLQNHPRTTERDFRGTGCTVYCALKHSGRRRQNLTKNMLRVLKSLVVSVCSASSAGT